VAQEALSRGGDAPTGRLVGGAEGLPSEEVILSLEPSSDLTKELTERVRAAVYNSVAAGSREGSTKSFLGRDTGAETDSEPLEVAGHAGILNYQPEELVITARAGTTLTAIEAALAERGQQLPFEPPHFGAAATLGGTIACGLSGPARPHAGAARDLVLGARVLTGRAEVLRFGGEVMKNVAGYDVSRLMAGAFGTLGVLLDLSLKVLPVPAVTRTRVQACGESEAIALMNRWAARPLPITATCWDGEGLWVRLAGAQQGVAAAGAAIGGESLESEAADAFWIHKIREQGHGFFTGDLPLWRLSVPPAAPPLGLPGKQLIEWGGAQRWLRTDAPREHIRATAAAAGGHATLFRGGDRTGEVFHPLPEGLMRLHRNLKVAFDPQGILNPGRLYRGL
jgi:glycolate oxidase FAD binding subunit